MEGEAALSRQFLPSPSESVQGQDTTNQPPRAKGKTGSGLSLLHPAIVSVLQRVPLSAQREGERDGAEKRKRAAARARSFIEGDRMRRSAGVGGPRATSSHVEEGKEEGGVQAWLYDLDFCPPSCPLLKKGMTALAGHEEGSERGSPDKEPGLQAEEGQEEELFEGLFFSHDEAEAEQGALHFADALRGKCFAARGGAHNPVL